MRIGTCLPVRAYAGHLFEDAVAVDVGQEGMTQRMPADAVASLEQPPCHIGTQPVIRLVQVPGGLVAVQPLTTEEVQEIMRLASETPVPVRTLNDRYLRPSDAGQEGIVLDFRRMKAIERLDKRNLLAHVQRGLTFAELKKELDKKPVPD